MNGRMKPLKAFVDGMLAGLVAHTGAWLTLATIDRILYIIGHIVVTIALGTANTIGQR